MTQVKRVFVGGLSPEITQEDLQERFQKFGEVLDVQFKKKREYESTSEKIFAYLNVRSTPENLKKCISLYNKTKWKGSELRLQLAKENFLTRLEIERKNGFREEEKKPDKKKDNYEYHNPFENLPDPSSHEMRGCVPGTKVPGEENWVVGKYGRVLPIVHVRNKEKKKILKVDPSKFCHNLKRMKDEDTTKLLKQKNLTLCIDEEDTEIVKKQKGEFPEWKPSPSKQKKIDYEKLRELYLSNNNNTSRLNNVDTEPDFEIVSGDLSVSGVVRTFDSDDSDSDSYYTSIKNRQYRPANKNRKNSDSIDIVGNSSERNDSSCDSESHSDMDVPQTCDSEKKCNRNTKNDPLKKKMVKGSDRIQKTNTPASNLNSKPTILDQNSSKQSPITKTKPTMKPFGGTKTLYQDTCIENNMGDEKPAKLIGKQNSLEGASNLSVIEKLNAKSKSKHPNDKTEMVSSDISINKKLISEKSNSKVRSKLLKELPIESKPITESLPKSVDSEEDANDSASSADTDEIINSSKCRTPTNSVSDSKQRKSDMKILDLNKAKYHNRTPSLNSSLKVSSIDEFSSGLIEGEIPVENDLSDWSGGDDSDESDFEKFAIRELQKMGHLKKKETPKLVTTKQSGKYIKNDELSKIETKPSLKSNSNQPLLTGSNGRFNTDITGSVGDRRKVEVIMDDSCDSENKGSNSSDGNDSDDEESNGTSDGYLKSDDSGSDSDGSLSDDEKSDSDIRSENITTQNKRVIRNVEKSDSDSSTENSTTQKQPVDNAKKSKKLELTKNVKTSEMKIKTAVQEKCKDDGQKQRSDSKTVTQNKNVDQNRKQDNDTNKKRLESVKQRQMENQAQKSIIQKALANIDGTEKSNKKIVFDDSDDENLSSSVQNTDLLRKESSDSDSDVEDEDTTKKKVPGLFDSSEEDTSDSDKDMFKIRPEFEGKSGQKRMELQSRYGNDDRFKLDERFKDSDSDEAPDEPEKPVDEDEKTKSLKILEEVIGTKVIAEKRGKMFRDVSALHFDPTREDRAHYEVKTDPLKKDKKDKKKKNEAEVTKDKDTVEELPEVGKEKFFEVSDSLKDAFKTGSKTTDDSQGFSLLSAFGSHGDKDAVSDDEENDNMEVKTLKHKSNANLWQQQFDDESSDSERNDEDVDKSSDEDTEKKQNEAVVFSSSKSYFFFQENDERIAEGIKNFCRQESLEVIREKWLEKRPELVEAYRTKHKRLLRKVKMDKKHARKQIPHKRH